jgi:hypothetical protein
VWDVVATATLSAMGVGHLVVPPFQCHDNTSLGHIALRPGWLHANCVSLLAEPSPLCSSPPPLPSQGLGRRGRGTPLLVRLRTAASPATVMVCVTVAPGGNDSQDASWGWQVSAGGEDGSLHEAAAGTCCAAGAGWRLAAGSALGGLHCSAAEQWCWQTAAGGGRMFCWVAMKDGR